MPRAPTSPYAYSLPPVYLAVPGTTIVVDQHNTPLQDIAATLNTAQPILYGGTGATTVAGAQANLGITPITQLSFPTAAGTADAITVANTPPISGLVNRTLASFKAAASNTGAATINVDGFGARKLRKVIGGADTDVAEGDVLEDALYSLVFSSTADTGTGAWLMVNPSGPELVGATLAAASIGGSSILGSIISISSIFLSPDDDPSPIGDGLIEWSTLFNNIKVGDGVGTQRFLPGAAPGAIYGCTIANNVSDATNDIDFAAGTVADSTNLFYMAASALTKKLDASWVVGTNQGGLFSGSIANATYHCFIIMRPDTGVVDAGFDTSVTAANRPSDYTLYRRVGSIVRSGAAIVGFYQNGNTFTFSGTPPQVAQTNPGTSAVTRTMTSIPTGVVMTAVIGHALSDVSISNPTYGIVSALVGTDVAPSVSVFDTGILSGGASADAQGSTRQILTNTSAQIRSRISQSDADITEYINIFAYIDTRGTF